MGILLACWMTTAMLGGLVLLPTLIWVFRPKFIDAREPAAESDLALLQRAGGRDTRPAVTA